MRVQNVETSARWSIWKVACGAVGGESSPRAKADSSLRLPAAGRLRMTERKMPGFPTQVVGTPQTGGKPCATKKAPRNTKQRKEPGNVRTLRRRVRRGVGGVCR